MNPQRPRSLPSRRMSRPAAVEPSERSESRRNEAHCPRVRQLEALDTAPRRAHAVGNMADNDKPNPLEDVRKGLGLLFRAAKTTVEKLPTKDVEEAVITTAREVGRAVESVGRTIEREVFGGKDRKEGDAKPEDAKPDEPKADAKPEDGTDQKS